ncbi:hypothetical protein ACJX0J_038293, partial [Zea mays]
LFVALHDTAGLSLIVFRYIAPALSFQKKDIFIHVNYKKRTITTFAVIALSRWMNGFISIKPCAELVTQILIWTHDMKKNLCCFMLVQPYKIINRAAGMLSVFTWPIIRVFCIGLVAAAVNAGEENAILFTFIIDILRERERERLGTIGMHCVSMAKLRFRIFSSTVFSLCIYI